MKCLSVISTYINKNPRKGIVFSKAVDSFHAAKSEGQLVIVDDGSSQAHKNLIETLRQRYNYSVVTKKENTGISRAKNTCLRVFQESDCDVCFLLDDDVVVNQGWQKIYLDAFQKIPYKIFFHNDFFYISRAEKNFKFTIENINGINVVVANHTTGVCMILLKDVLKTIGFFRPFPGKWGHEHVEYSRRAIENGLSSQKGYCDVQGSNNLIKLNIQLSDFSLQEKRQMLTLNHAAKFSGSYQECVE
jgi:GT2 family glycosyltransferase